MGRRKCRGKGNISGSGPKRWPGSAASQPGWLCPTGDLQGSRPWTGGHYRHLTGRDPKIYRAALPQRTARPEFTQGQGQELWLQRGEEVLPWCTELGRARLRAGQPPSEQVPGRLWGFCRPLQWDLGPRHHTRGTSPTWPGPWLSGPGLQAVVWVSGT